MSTPTTPVQFNTRNFSEECQRRKRKENISYKNRKQVRISLFRRYAAIPGKQVSRTNEQID